MISLYILGTVLPTIITGQCQVDLDALTGEFPPLLIQRGDFIFPSSRTEDDKRILSFGEGDPLDLYCHGSEKGQAETTVTLAGEDTGDSRVQLTCLGGVFKRLLYETTVSVEAASCNKKQEPLLMRRKEQCSHIGADGRDDELSFLTRASIGWRIDGVYQE